MPHKWPGFLWKKEKVVSESGDEADKIIEHTRSY